MASWKHLFVLLLLLVEAPLHGQSTHHNLISPFDLGVEYLYKLVLKSKAQPQTIHVDDESGFKCKATLYIQPKPFGEEKILICKLDVHSLKLFNGPDDDDSSSKNTTEYLVDLEGDRYKDRIHELEKTFEVHLDERQLLKHIRTSDDDELWSVNIKRAIGSNLQFPVKKGETQAFAMEPSVGGLCHSSYYTVPSGNKIVVYKVRDADKCQGKPLIHEPSRSSIFCGCANKDMCKLYAKNPQRAVFTLRGDGNILEEAEFKGSSVFSVSPNGFILEEKNNLQLKLISTGTPTTDLTVGSESTEHKPTFVFENPEESLDSLLSFEEPPQRFRLKKFYFDQDNLRNEIYRRITRIARIIKDHIHSEEFFHDSMKPMFGTGKFIGSLSLDSLKKLWHSLETDEDPKSRQILTRYLSIAGSSHSIYFLYTLGKEKKLTDFEASFSFTWSTSIKGLSNALLKSIWEVLEQYDKSTGTYEHALMGFGTLVSHACETPTIYENDEKIGKVLPPQCDWEGLKVFANLLRDQAIHGKTYSLQLASLLALTNIANDYSREVAEEIAFDTSKNTYLRAHALFSIHKEQHPLNPELGNRLIYIITNRSESHHLRLKALTLIFVHGSYDIQYITMKIAEKYLEPQLQHYTYSLLKSLSQLEPNCVANKAETAKRLLNSIDHHHDGGHKMHSWTQYFKYKDNEYGFSGGIFTVLHQSPKSYLPSHVYAHYSGKLRHIEFVPIQFQLTLHGVESVYPYGYSPKETTDFEGEEKIEERDHGDFYFELILKYQNKVAFLKTYTLEEIARIIAKKDGLTEFVRSIIGNVILGEIYGSEFSFVNDLGLPVKLHASMPFLKVSDLELSNKSPDSLFISYALRWLAIASLSFSVYNPVADTLHGVSRSSTTTLSVPFESTVSLKHLKESQVSPRIIVYPSKDITTYVNINSSIITTLFDLSEEKATDLGRSDHYEGSSVPTYHIVDVNKDLGSTCYLEKSVVYPLKHTASVPCSFARGSLDELRGHMCRKFFIENLPHNDYNVFSTFMAMRGHLRDFYAIQPHKGNIRLAVTKTHVIKEIALFLTTVSHSKEEEPKRTDTYGFRISISYLNGDASSYDASIEYKQLSLVRHDVNAKFTRKTLHGKYEVCLEGKIEYPEFTGLDVWSGESKKTSEYLIVWGKQCSEREGSLSLKMEADYSQEQENGFHFEPKEVTESSRLTLKHILKIYNENAEGIVDLHLLKKLCSSDISHLRTGATIAASDACAHLAYYSSQVTHSIVHIQHQNLPFDLKKAYYKILSLLRVMFKPHHDIKESRSVREETGVGHVTVERKISVANETVSYLFSSSLFDDVFTSIPLTQLSFALRPSYKLWNTKFWLEKLGMLRTCQVTSEYVRLIQGYAVANNLSHCPTVISRDCSDAAIFTVLARRAKTDHHETAATIFLRKSRITSDLIKIEIEPSKKENYLQLTVDDKTVSVTDDSPFCYEEEDRSCLFRIWKVNSAYLVKAIWNHGVYVAFDGTFLNVGVGARHTGTHCGLCGDYSGGFSETISPPGYEWEHLHDSPQKQLKSAGSVNEQWTLKSPC